MGELNELYIIIVFCQNNCGAVNVHEFFIFIV